ncbi:D-amino-acid transaminase [Paenibacillus allorhizosphaerae]|uniref:D-alanine aminotransferase n=1 Tax=Paenibacillus allorhizosphaerae TaxID=2849866 RepID=A0ABN7TQ96_9BACL|nr:D-amino-acid transaminase [Paenibacillus allorhizosphaerae]CAG7651043.1 D-alanine aminotransferase [Paenibacillus allorhizosphaerae]
MQQIYLYQNRLIPLTQVHISPEDRGYYFGDGAYEVFRVYNGILYETEAHFTRLKKTVDALRIKLPADHTALTRQLEELVRANRLQEGIVYMQITRGTAPRVHAFPAGAEPVLMAYTQPLARPVATMEKGISAVTTEDIRWLRCDLKTLNLLPNVMAKQTAVDHGTGDVVFHRSGTVTECSASNMMIVKNGVVRTHPADNLILHGVTRAVVLRLAQSEGIPTQETPFTVEELLQADEAFITGTTVEVTPVTSVDGKPIGDGRPGAVTRQLQQAFEAAIPTA